MRVTNVGATQWLEQIRKTQRHGEEERMGSHVHPYIFTVPESLRIERQEAYWPQVASLGPYHHLKLELYEAESINIGLQSKLRKEQEGVDLRFWLMRSF